MNTQSEVTTCKTCGAQFAAMHAYTCPMFAAPFQVPDDNGTTFHDDPKLAAYKYAAWAKLSLGRTFAMCVADGVYTVDVAGLERARFARTAEAR